LGGFSGHTGICFMNPCAGGCWMPSCGGAGQGGTSSGGAGAGQGGFSGHTGICFMQPCSPGCWQPSCGGASSGGGRAGSGGTLGGAGFGGTGSGEGGLGGGGAGGAAQMFESRAEPPRSVRACYLLSGYEGDPCLPADDGILTWLDDRPVRCEPHVTEGPFSGFDGQVRTCCYTVACRDASLPAPNGLIHGPR
jgi:hypothetical protein